MINELLPNLGGADVLYVLFQARIGCEFLIEFLQ